MVNLFPDHSFHKINKKSISHLTAPNKLCLNPSKRTMKQIFIY